MFQKLIKKLNKINHFALFAFVCCIGLLAYLPLINAYFVHDEWQTFLYFESIKDKSYLDGIKLLVSPQPGQYIPLTFIITYTLYLFFNLNYYVFLFFSLILHGFVGFLLMYLLLKITNKRLLSLLGGFFFIIAPHHFQATSWIVANIGYTLSAIFMISGFIFFLKWLEIAKPKFALLSSFFILLSLLSKDISVYAIIFLPAMALLLKEKKSYFIKSIFIVFPSLILEIWHFWYLRANPYVELLVTSPPGWQNLISLPLRSIAESIIPQHIIYWLSKAILLMFPPYSLEKLNTTAFNQQVESMGAFIIVLIITFLFILIGIKIKSKIFLIGGLLTGLAGLPYFFVDTENFSLLQPRYIYIPLMGMCLAIIPLINIAFKKWRLKSTVALSIILFFFMISTFKMSYDLAGNGSERKHILENISQSLPPESINTIFYVQSDTSFYGLPDNVKTLPFQVGPGKVLAAYLYEKIYIPFQVYDYFTFLEIGSEGYFSDESGGYGYFRNYDKLKFLVKTNKIQIDNIYSFKYIKSLGNVTDITEEIRDKLRSS